MEFENQATLSFNNKVLKSNTVTGELVSPVTILKYSVQNNYQQNSQIVYTVSVTNTLDTDQWALLTDDMGANGELYSPLTLKQSLRPPIIILPLLNLLLVKPTGVSSGSISAQIYSNRVDITFILPAKTTAIVSYALDLTEFADLTPGASITNNAVLYVRPNMFGNFTYADESSYTIEVSDYSDIRISKYLSDKQVAAGQPLTYVLMASNYGNAESSPEITDVIEPHLTNIRVYVNGSELNNGTEYTYDTTSSLLTIPQGTLTIPPAEFTKETSGEWTITPSASEITITGIAIQN